jgi:UPF0755 protein
MRIHLYKFILTSSLVLTILGALVIWNLYNSLNTQIFTKEEIIFLIEKNQCLSTILNNLLKKEIIDDPQVVKYALKIFRPNIKFLQGEYLIKPQETITDLINKFSTAKVLQRKFTIIEGSTVKNVKYMLEREEALNGEIYEKVEEGYLYPTTYYFFFGQDRNELFKKMHLNMVQALKDLYKKTPDKSKTLNEVVNIASIVEKETQRPEERSRVAAVYLNRLKKRMRLQADPTVIYDLSEKIGYINRPLTLKDLQIDSPYNTYKIFGLPPTAIAIPSIESVKAVLNPSDTDDLYFVANNKGGHCFANNLLSHNINVFRYRSNSKEGCQ